MPQSIFGVALLFDLWGVGKPGLFMDEFGKVAKAPFVLDLAIGNLDDVVAHACECGSALGIGETRSFAVMSGAALAFQNDAHAVGDTFDEDIGITAGFVIQRTCGFAERDACVIGDAYTQTAFVAGE